MVGGILFVTATIGAQALAKRQVNVQANAFLPITGFKGFAAAGHPHSRGKSFVPIGHSRITGIARHRLIVAGHQCSKICRLHAAKRKKKY
jgi:hypothetical protein